MENKILTEEGQRLWDNMLAYEELSKPAPPPPRKPIERKSKHEVELDWLRGEITGMINNSELVIKDCQTILAACPTREEYIISDAKVAMELHKKLIGRLNRVLNGIHAFDDRIEVTVQSDGKTIELID